MSQSRMFVRVESRAAHEPRRMGPLAEDHPLVDEEECPACGYAFEPGEEVTLIALGPGPSREAQDKAAAGHPYDAYAIAVHAGCAGVR